MNTRPSASRAAVGTIPNPHARQPTGRAHSHSLSVGSINSSHRIDRRRKSTSSNASNAAVLSLVAESLAEQSSPSTKPARRVGSKGSYSAFASSLPAGNGFGQTTFEAKPSSAVTDGPGLATLPEAGIPVKSRARRASDGSSLAKVDGKRQVHGELRCETCGKGYKHSSCLYKHLWEHTPEWAITSKLLISKHQQVQLLEAASVLLLMNNNAVDSDASSPEASSSDPQSDGISSKADSPPPLTEESYSQSLGSGRVDKRLSSNSSMYSHSYQSSVFAHSRQISSDNRPTTSGTSVTSFTDEEREEMSAAFNLLSCSYGTPKTGPTALSGDIPPVPPLPAQYIGQTSSEHLSGSTITGVPNAKPSFVRGHHDEDIDMMVEDNVHVHRSDDEEEGMFGKMEE
ncbi:hypothetical protein BT63DRAFT_274945 [Microthyrium microscopicum]|uniref:C2H2-type domain-containing protein n=1 Tax=Microthyrium microscopicum TaxID=703497 RepID=A0A6A6UBA6_9PEZI|nr:hypothetical protein BT63DRAFT_274945 [Microthyrium microscopicum]